MVANSRSKAKAQAVKSTRATRSSGGVIPQKSADDQNGTVAATPSSAAPSVKKTTTKKTQPKASTSRVTNGQGNGKDAEVFCSCRTGDDGSPMIKCEGKCTEWYHFRCVNLSEDVGGEIDRYICPTCEAKMGLKTIMDWEMPEATLEVEKQLTTGKAKVARKARVAKDVPVDEESEESGDGSEDDYVAEFGKKQATSLKKTTRRPSLSSDRTHSDFASSDEERPRRISRGGGVKKKGKKSLMSPVVEDSPLLKRKPSSQQDSLSKRARTTSDAPASDDAMRKYCLSKLGDIIRPMFVEHRQSEKNMEQGLGSQGASHVELTEDERNVIEQSSVAFVTELESCMMNIYSEPDKSGRPSAGAKYKERFRMLSFNLAKDDRVALRKGISSGRITPSQLNVMSSTDLANEQTKLEIQDAEKEALAHSILPKMQAPTAKITHKGIEVLENNASAQRNAEAVAAEEERIEAEKREREKMARLRSTSLSQLSPITPASPSAPASAVPTSPSVSNTLPWGAPPPLPTPLQEQRKLMLPRPPMRPLFVPSASDYVSMEGGLNLADLINIDDDNPVEQEQAASSSDVVANPSSDSSPDTNVTPEVATASGPSPFAQAETLVSPSQQSSFDLNSIWISKGNTAEEPPVSEAPKEERGESEEADEGDAMDIESADEDSDDRALDALLEHDDNVGVQSATGKEKDSVDLNSLGVVWCGSISMPIDASTTLSPKVITKQIGGRSLQPASAAWPTLFPSSDARIDGRVPVPNSSQYLISMRLNAAKELVAVCFMPSSEEDSLKFDELSEFLIKKDRHALVFPWGIHPTPQAPGRELYIIPLLKDQPLPEYIELLDNLQLPKERTTNVLVGVFVLSKGKLSELPVPEPTLATPPVTGQVPVQPFVPTLPPAGPQPSDPSLAWVNSVLGQIDPVVLNAGVASLSKEDLTVMLQNLTQAGAIAPIAAPPPPPPPLAIPPVVQHPGPAPGFPSLTIPTFAPNHPPYPSQRSPQGHSPPYPPSGRSGYDDRDYDDRYDRRPYVKDGAGLGRGRGNDRGRRGSRGRGRGYHNESDRSFQRGRDSGWRGRGREARPV